MCTLPDCGDGEVCNLDTGICEEEVVIQVGSAIISEYVEGSSNNKAVEIFNTGTIPLDCVLLKSANGNTPQPVGALFTLPVQGIYLMCHSSASLGPVSCAACLKEYLLDEIP
jgi:hypothetical protein